jgi:hypothetical protein
MLGFYCGLAEGDRGFGGGVARKFLRFLETIHAKGLFVNEGTLEPLVFRDR